MKPSTATIVLVLAMVFLMTPVTPAAAQCEFPQAASPVAQTMTYRFAVRSLADTVTLSVTLEFAGSASGVDTLVLPRQWAGQQLHSLHKLRAVGRRVAIDSVPNGGPPVVRHPPGERVRIAYEISKDWDGPLEHPYEFHPMISADYLEMTGSNALVRPRFDAYTPIVTHYDWTDLPTSWQLATSFGAATGSTGERGVETSPGRCQTFTGTWTDVANALYAAGDFRLHAFTIGGKPAILAIRGEWTYSDSAVVAEIRRDVGLVRTFWHNNDARYFLATWAPFASDRNGSDGTGFTNGMWMFVPRSSSLATQIPTITHEAFHAWASRRMGHLANADAARLAWFTEGFTMYYADVIAYRAGLVSLADVVARANRDLTAFAGSTDPYTRGEVIARWLDGVIRDTSHGTRSLDDAMRDMVRESDQALTLDRLLSTVDRYLTPNDQRVLQQLAAGAGSPPMPPAGLLAPCVRVTMESAAAHPQLHIRANYLPTAGVCGLSGARVGDGPQR